MVNGKNCQMAGFSSIQMVNVQRMSGVTFITELQEEQIGTDLTRMNI